MHAAMALTVDQHQAGEVGQQGEQADAHHQPGLRLAAIQPAPRHFGQQQERQQALYQPGQARCTELATGCLTHRQQGHAIHRRIGEHIQGVGDQPGGLGQQAHGQFQGKHQGVDQQQGVQHPALCGRIRRAGLDALVGAGVEQLGAQIEAGQAGGDRTNILVVQHLQPTLAQIEQQPAYLAHGLQGHAHQTLLGHAIHGLDAKVADPGRCALRGWV